MIDVSKATLSDSIDACDILSRCRGLHNMMSQIKPIWGSAKDAAHAFVIANRYANVGSPACMPCHLKAWAVLKLIENNKP